MNFKTMIKIIPKYIARLLTIGKVKLKKIILWLGSFQSKLKSEAPKIKKILTHIKSIPLKLRSAFLYILKIFMNLRYRYLRKRFIIPSTIIIILLALAIPTIYLLNIINDSKDYKTVLAAQPNKKTIQKQTPIPNIPNSLITNTRQPQKSLVENDTDVDQIKLPDTNLITILLLGIDRTEERDKSIGISRSDTIALASINLDTKKVNVLSIPRDTYTFIPIENKKDKINHAYAFGSLRGEGVKGSIDAVEKFIKYAKVDYYFSIDMQPVAEIVDKLGGVELDVDIEIKNKLHKGMQLLDGKKAEEYIRYRYTSKGDIDRIMHQQKLATAMMAKLKASGRIMDAVSIVFDYHEFVKTNMSPKQLMAFAKLWSDIPSGNSSYFIVPGEDRITNKVWYYFPDIIGTEAILKQIFH